LNPGVFTFSSWFSGITHGVDREELMGETATAEDLSMLDRKLNHRRMIVQPAPEVAFEAFLARKGRIE
jgi:hypothetical protein